MRAVLLMCCCVGRRAPRSSLGPTRSQRARGGRDRDSHVIIWTCHRVSHRDILGQIWQLRGRSKEPIGREGDASAPYRPLGLMYILYTVELSTVSRARQFGREPLKIGINIANQVANVDNCWS